MNMSLVQMFIEAGWVAKGVIAALLIMSIYSIAVMIDKWRSFRAARAESMLFLPLFVRALKDNNFAGALDAARKHNKSHLAKVVAAGLIEYDNDKLEIKDAHDMVGAIGRALDRAVSLTSAEMKKGTGGLATIGSTAPFVGLFGTVVGIINAFKGISTEKSTGLGAVAGGISEALVTTAIGLFVAIPAVWMFNYFTSKIEAFDVEMGNSSSELIDYFLKRSQRGAGARK